ncbi:MAG: hypothetical protein M9892_07480 [Bacteroidetes bacterium]|nr:hypothetical protein [Bacteroidota bacterium]
MNAKDHLKLMKSGFSIIRADMFRLQIKIKSGMQDYRILEKGFASKAAVERRMKELLKDDMTVED